MSQSSFVFELIERLRSVLPDTGKTIGLHEPEFKGQEWAFVKECIDTGWVSSVGKYVDQFERKLEEITGAERAVAAVNGTAALHICLVAAGVQPGDEVLTPALTFIATANAIKYCMACPHFVDSSEKTLGICPQKLGNYLKEIARVENGVCINKKSGRVIRAIVPMHVFGHCVDLDPLVEVCNEFSITLIEDAAESLGSYYKGRHTGTFGKLGAISFNGNKIVTTGGGGAVITSDQELGNRIKHLTTTAKRPHAWEFFHDSTGYNYRMPNINAALGCAQLEQLPTFLARKRKLAEAYRACFADFTGLSFFVEPDFSKSNYWLNTLILDQSHADYREQVLELTNKSGIACRPVWTLMSRLPIHAECSRSDLAVAESLEMRVINIPSSVFLGT